ncbi:hypothetical protein QF022_000636 [Vogesella perlucida]|nr:hypothetical protein [Vogesella perlucida]
MEHAQALLKSLYVMAMMVEARDAYTGGHLWRVSQFARLVAERMQLPADDVARVELGGFLHDLGKVGIPDAVLNKRDRLSDEEYAVIKTHPQVGADLLAGHPLAALAMDAVWLHHETPDGRGYPQGLSGSAIPRVARIVGVVDALDAMTSSRPYRAGMPLATALQIIEDNLGRQFDSEVGRVVLGLGRDGALEAIIGHSAPGRPLQSCAACGPTLVMHSAVQDGDTVHCPSCAMGYHVSHQQGHWQVAATGVANPVLARQPRADTALIERLVQPAYRLLPQPKRWLGWFGAPA